MLMRVRMPALSIKDRELTTSPMETRQSIVYGLVTVGSLRATTVPCPTGRSAETTLFRIWGLGGPRRDRREREAG